MGIAVCLAAAAWMRRPSSTSAQDNNMVLIDGGTFTMGCSEHYFPDACPPHPVTLESFWIDKTEVTNEAFAKFVKATGYITAAERQPPALPGVPPENLVAGSLVFTAPSQPLFAKECPSCMHHSRWWQYVPGASWRHPEGPASTLLGREKHPVVHIAWQDAQAYAQWLGKRLPTEAEFEYAARGGLEGKKYSWGNQRTPEKKWLTNIWQGHFPFHNSLEDGFYTTAPVGAFAPNGYGIYDMTGNVWEWCLDWYDAHYYKKLADLSNCTHNPQGPSSSNDPEEPETPKKVQRGGSFLCNDSYCSRYKVGGRGKGEPDSSASHLGFRCAKDAVIKRKIE